MKLDGSEFKIARVKEPKPGVVNQYREDRHVLSKHAYEFADGSLVVDHTDLVNPDKSVGHSVVHFVADHPIGRCLGALFAVVMCRRLL